MHKTITLTPEELDAELAEITGEVLPPTMTSRLAHNTQMDSEGRCPNGPDCVFCIADRQADEREHGDYSSTTWKAQR